jgi:hypothetical protein
MRSLLLALVVLLVGAASAHAEPPNASISNDGLLYEAVQVADEWWAAQGQYPEKGRVMEYDKADKDSREIARGDMPGDDVYFEREYVRRTRALLRRGWRAHRAAIETLCMATIHERGHNLHLDHVKGRSIMHDTLGNHPVVGRCRAWAVKLAPATHSGVRGYDEGSD